MTEALHVFQRLLRGGEDVGRISSLLKSHMGKPRRGVSRCGPNGNPCLVPRGWL
ncbi:hypothetical protein NY78_1528 [Desulfovibrio sp. TomC]|nr:hypothetical protein NY78_1528 [Desulfovibrio sp. TomC]